MPPSFEPSVLLPLSPRDAAIGGVGLSLAFVLDARPSDLDVDAVRAAVERVVDKWRFLAGRLVAVPGGYAVLAPTGPLPADYRALVFDVVDKRGEASPFADLPALSQAQGHLIPLPGLSLIKPPAVPSSLAEYVKKDWPITSWFITVFKDATVVSLSVPHGCFDAWGLGLATRALDAELHGRAWDVPPLHAENQLEKRLAEVEQLPFSQAEKDATPPPMIGWTGAWPPQNVVKLLANGAYEQKWHKAEDGCLFVGKDLLAPLVKEVKEQVAKETDGKEFVSEGDVLVNWLYQAIYSHDPTPPQSFHASCAVSLRDLVSTPELTLAHYPHNAVSGYSLNSSSPSPTAEFLRTPLAHLALQHRRLLTASRTLPAVQALLTWIRTHTSPAFPAIPEADASWALPWGSRGGERVGYWIYSDQRAAGMPLVSWPKSGGKEGETLALKAFMELGTSLNQFVAVNELPGQGWIFTATMRRARWESARKVVDELKQRAEAQKSATA
ncbi:hypothetical protein JCM10449v2_006804 [Rhodotorula kratochvilovae]